MHGRQHLMSKMLGPRYDGGADSGRRASTDLEFVFFDNAAQDVPSEQSDEVGEAGGIRVEVITGFEQGLIDGMCAWKK